LSASTARRQLRSNSSWRSTCRAYVKRFQKSVHNKHNMKHVHGTQAAAQQLLVAVHVQAIDSVQNFKICRARRLCTTAEQARSTLLVRAPPEPKQQQTRSLAKAKATIE
jgi:ribosomal protein S20